MSRANCHRKVHANTLTVSESDELANIKLINETINILVYPHATNVSKG